MKRLSLSISFLALSILTGVVASNTTRSQGEKARLNTPYTPVIPRTWDSLAMADTELPLATARASPRHLPTSYYYQLPERVAYKTYPVYAPDQAALLAFLKTL